MAKNPSQIKQVKSAMRGEFMKSKLYRWSVAALFSLSIFAISSSAEAYCTKVPSHWVNGYKVPAHKVCSGGHYRYGYKHCWWHNRQRVCAYR